MEDMDKKKGSVDFNEKSWIKWEHCFQRDPDASWKKIQQNREPNGKILNLHQYLEELGSFENQAGPASGPTSK